MATEVKLPRLGQGMESGVVRWLKAEGDAVEKGEPLYELDTEKVTQEVEAEASGVLLKIAVAEGEADVGKTVAVIGEEGEEVSVARLVRTAGRPAAKGEAAEEVDEDPQEEGRRARPRGRARARPGGVRDRRRARDPPGTPAETRADGRIKASPLARRIARERGIEPRRARRHRPGGPHRRRGRRARRRARRSPGLAGPPPGEVETIPLTSLRKTIARRLTEAWTVPAFQLSMSADMTPRQRAARAARRARARGRHEADRLRHPDQGRRGRADAPPRGERALRRRRASGSSRPRTSASPSRPSTASSSR